ncbi:response regulator transcription factor [Vibrio mangrovi]|uniref:Response regulator transcription factor n=1 Tax=Vibrio mangrovi TaxID=474394 RepID=A0A1Y6IXS5_9VIBR|nr:response regulator transcription factor [Vibrio mangrovi]MDW6001957.1 response regulator transcription factor [Vibrio mangrovi]SMS02495.1 Transcriptional regulatory protein DegU [Vibrio mangrovi]
MTIRLLIVDDHSIVREGLKQLLALYDDIEVIAEAVDGDDLLNILELHRPDIITLDILMPGLSGIPLIEKVVQRYPELPILILSMHNETQITRRTLRAGARGYLSKDCDAETLITAIRRIAEGGRFIQSDMAEKLVFEFDEVIDSPKHENLSKREFHIFCLLARGLSVNEIAEELHISNKTVSTHKFRLMQKMDFTSNTEIVRYALAHNLIK